MKISEKIVYLLSVLFVVGNVFAQNVTTTPKEGQRGKENLLNDLRDGRVYKTVKIGTQVWMAQNLNYASEESMCFDKKEANCKVQGRLYTWNAAKRACPSGWHLPSVEDFEKLAKFTGGKEENLKAKSGWKAMPYCEEKGCFVDDEYDDCPCCCDKPVQKKNNGNDKFGFSMIPSNYCFEGGKYCNSENAAYFWTSTNPPTESFGEGQHGYSVVNGINTFLCNEGPAPACYDQNFFAVRCLKD